jgi:hypothetical protein
MMNKLNVHIVDGFQKKFARETQKVTQYLTQF